MACYEIVLEQSYYGQQIVNRWNYVSGSIPSGQSGALLALAGMGFAPFGGDPILSGDTIGAILQSLQTAEVTFVQAIAKNLYSVTDFYTYAFPPDTNGTSGGSEGMSPAIAFGYTTDRTRSDIRRGQKRFVGIEESNVGGGGVILSAGTFQTLGDAMADINVVNVEGAAVTFTPYVFGKKEYTTPTGKKAYEYWPDETQQLEHIARINAWTLKSTVRTQTSRQYSRGS